LPKKAKKPKKPKKNIKKIPQKTKKRIVVAHIATAQEAIKTIDQDLPIKNAASTIAQESLRTTKNQPRLVKTPLKSIDPKSFAPAGQRTSTDARYSPSMLATRMEAQS
jgi:hypothetical protein